jgi:YihY family inner membrane protein
MPRDAAAISYFSLFALFPSVLVLLAVGSDILSLFGIRKSMLQAITSLLPVSSAFLESNLPQMLSPSPALVLSCVFVMTWTSAWIFGLIESGLNRAWGVTGRRTFWQSRVRSIMVVALGGSILLSAAGILAMVTTSRNSPTWYEHDPIITWLTRFVLLMAVFLLAILVFFCVYKLMPDKKVLWPEALSGAILAALLWESGSIVFFRLVPFFDFERVYGRMGMIITLMAWVYTSNLILLFGGNFSAQLHRPSTEGQPADERGGSRPVEEQQPARKIRPFLRPR